MDLSTWLVVGTVCLLFVSLGLWVVSRIFPADRARAAGSEPHIDPHHERSHP
jgi:hypothetical protein